MRMPLRLSFDDSKSLIQFYAMAYRKQQAEQLVPAEGQVILFLVYGQSGDLRILVSPEWRQTVSLSDHAYIEAILADFRERAHSAPEALLEQVSSLSVGPLVAYTCGIRLEEFPELHTLSTTFTELK